MMSSLSSSDQQQSPDPPSGWIVCMGRTGYIANGIVYATVGIMALLLALGVRSRNGNGGPDQSDALDRLSHLWLLGPFLLTVLALGLACYAAWKFIACWYDPANEGTHGRAMIQRLRYVFVGLSYLTLSVQALRQVGEAGKDGGVGEGVDDWTNRLMSQPLGKCLVGLAGAMLVGHGVHSLYNAWTNQFTDKLQLSVMSDQEQKQAMTYGRAGNFANFVTTTMTGCFILHSAVKANPTADTGLSAALTTLLEQPHGKWMLGMVAICLIGNGIFQGLLAKYRPVFVQYSADTADASNSLPEMNELV